MNQTKKKKSRPRNKQSKAQPNKSTVQVVSQPAAKGIVMGRAMPVFNGKAGVLRLRHHEILQTIVSTTDKYTVRSVNLVPANFSWLSGVAVNFSKWKWHALNLVYVPACSTSVQGNIDMALQYDGNDIPATTPEELSVMYGHSGGPVWSGTAGCRLLDNATMSGRGKPPEAIATIVDVSKFSKSNYLYRSGALSGDSQTIYCPCDLQYGVTAGITPTVGAIGYIWATYDVEMFEPLPARLNK
nr:coat protein [Sowbane mosaic virus]